MHGANTLAYTASALSFMFQVLGKPIILTGAELPLSDFGSDAERNLVNALNIAGTYNANHVHEVCIMYGQRLLRGNRATKKEALSTFEGFYSPNDGGELGATKGLELVLNHGLLRKSPGSKHAVAPYMIKDTSVVYILDVYPDMNMDLFDYLISRTNPVTPKTANLQVSFFALMAQVISLTEFLVVKAKVCLRN